MEKLLIAIGFGQRAYGRWLFQRLLAGIIVVASLTIVISIMISVMLVSGLYIGYFALLQYGAEPAAAMIIIGIAAILTVIMLILSALACLHHLRQMPRNLLKRSPLASRAMNALDAFTDGLMAD